MKEEALQVALKQRSDSPRLIANKKEFDQAVKDYVLKDISKGLYFNNNAKFIRRTKMGGHLSNTLKKAGLENVGLQMPEIDSQRGMDNMVMITEEN